MTHSAQLVNRSLELVGEGLSTSEVARRLGVPRATVRDWLAGRLPRRFHRDGIDCAECGGIHDVDRLPAAYAYLLGMYLGDGCLSEHARGVFKLYSKSWPCLFPQHGPGRKHEREIALTDWQWSHVERRPALILRGLIHSDGCRFQNKGRGWSHPRYSFANKSEDIKAIFCTACDLLDLHWTRSGEKTIYVSRKADVALLDRFVGPKC